MEWQRACRATARALGTDLLGAQCTDAIGQACCAARAGRASFVRAQATRTAGFPCSALARPSPARTDREVSWAARPASRQSFHSRTGPWRGAASEAHRGSEWRADAWARPAWTRHRDDPRYWTKLRDRPWFTGGCAHLPPSYPGRGTWEGARWGGQVDPGTGAEVAYTGPYSGYAEPPGVLTPQHEALVVRLPDGRLERLGELTDEEFEDVKGDLVARWWPSVAVGGACDGARAALSFAPQHAWSRTPFAALVRRWDGRHDLVEHCLQSELAEMWELWQQERDVDEALRTEPSWWRLGAWVAGIAFWWAVLYVFVVRWLPQRFPLQEERRARWGRHGVHKAITELHYHPQVAAAIGRPIYPERIPIVYRGKAEYAFASAGYWDDGNRGTREPRFHTDIRFVAVGPRGRAVVWGDICWYNLFESWMTPPLFFLRWSWFWHYLFVEIEGKKLTLVSPAWDEDRKKGSALSGPLRRWWQW
ncbi:unnamed protein product [Pedinophyceae sp. YPF-701]|nr:unnamed protein product [Pedinophyceae sp. YPF-701]